jgi:hypothetical protein
LEENGITFFDVSPQNIVFYPECKENPILNNFKYGLQENRLNSINIMTIVENLENFTYQPIEIHLLFYIIKNNIEIFSEIYIEQICDVFIGNLCILDFFSSSYKDSYRAECRFLLEKHIGSSQKVIVKDVLERRNKIDIYCLSVIYLHVFACMMMCFSLKGTAISKIVAAFSKNIHPDPDKRMCLTNFYGFYTEMIDKIDDWNFIKNIDNEKLNVLFVKLTQ